MEWFRGHQLGRGTFATITLAIPSPELDRFPPLMAVKSSELASSASLKDEKRILDQIGSCREVVKCFGDSYTVERDGRKMYNLLLEYAGGGSLADILKNHGGKVPEFDIRRYTAAILRGLRHIHASGFVHCDIKLANVLVFDNGDCKIADFGLAKKTAEKGSENYEFRGTPMYMSPESVNAGEYEPPSDVWALGCAVMEMATGKPPWNYSPESDIFNLVMRIGAGEEVPELPEKMSDEGRDFLGKCLVKDPRKRWTVEMLLNHPFVAVYDTVSSEQTELPAVSPRNPFDFPEFVSPAPSSGNPWDNLSFSCSVISPEVISRSDLDSAISRLRQLVTEREKEPNWSVSESWVTVR